jgi:hypothetical protein
MTRFRLLCGDIATGAIDLAGGRDLPSRQGISTFLPTLTGAEAERVGIAVDAAFEAGGSV